MEDERTLVILKPDAVKRGLIGEVINRFEKTGLKMVGAKMVRAERSLLEKHYPADREDLTRNIGQRTLESYKEMGLDPKEQFGETDPLKIGATVRDWLIDYMTSGPVLAFVLQGPHAIEVVRKIVGFTLPQKSQPGTIRGDYSFDSSYLANKNKRPIRNLIHASGNEEEAEFELSLWFSKSDMFDYDTVHQAHMREK